MNKAQLVTRYIKHLEESANFKSGTFNIHRNGLIGNRFEMPNVSYTNPLCLIVKRQPTHIQAHLVFSDTQANAQKTKRA